MSSHPLLIAPVGRSLVRLAGPTTALMFVQICVGVAETWIVGRLGTDALAALTLVVPFLVLMLNMANGGMGGSVAASLARALGAGRNDDAQALVWHALMLGLGLGVVSTALAWSFERVLFGAMGGRGAALQQALTYSTIYFGAAMVLWTVAFLSALLRGSGDAITPGRIGATTSLLYVPLAAALALGVGRWPGLGLTGSAIAVFAVNTLAALLLARAIRRGRLGFVPTLKGVRLQARLFGEILHVGLMGSVTTIAASATAVLVTALVGRFGTAALAGYGIAIRLEFMVAPIAFGIGTGLTTLVGVAAGAGDWRRAVRVAWTGGMIAFWVIGGIGWLIALLPELWARLFTADPRVIADSVAGITRMAPFYCLFGFGLALNFASQGAGTMKAPLFGSLVRFAVATLGGWFAVEKLGLGLDGVFAAVAVSLVAYGAMIGGTLLIRPWQAKRYATPSPVRSRGS